MQEVEMNLWDAALAGDDNEASDYHGEDSVSFGQLLSLLARSR